MMGVLNLIMAGTAGAGKSALTWSFGEWMEKNTGQRVAYVNFDPGCDSTPFTPDFDVRDHFTIGGIMREEGLGPNGAMVRASELLERRAGEFSRQISGLGADIRLIDTPGQMEIFLFHGGPAMVELMDGAPITLFLIDAEIATMASGLVLARLLGLVASLRLGTPAISVLNKIDLVGERLSDIDMMLADDELIRERLIKERSGVTVDLMLRLSETLPKLLPPARTVRTSAKTGEGMRDLYDIVHEVSCVCGDLT